MQRQPWRCCIHTHSAEKVYMCFYDLEKAFDSIQYPVLLKRLWGRWQSLEALTKLVYVSEEHGESERLAVLTIHSRVWSSPRTCPLPSPFPTDNGPPLEILTKQRSGSSLLVAHMLEVSSILTTISSSRATLQEQINTVCTFAANNGLTLNPTKCEVVLQHLPHSCLRG